MLYDAHLCGLSEEFQCAAGDEVVTCAAAQLLCGGAAETAVQDVDDLFAIRADDHGVQVPVPHPLDGSRRRAEADSLHPGRQARARSAWVANSVAGSVESADGGVDLAGSREASSVPSGWDGLRVSKRERSLARSWHQLVQFGNR